MNEQPDIVLPHRLRPGLPGSDSEP